jgi:hypothetical protein
MWDPHFQDLWCKNDFDDDINDIQTYPLTNINNDNLLHDPILKDLYNDIRTYSLRLLPRLGPFPKTVNNKNVNHSVTKLYNTQTFATLPLIYTFDYRLITKALRGDVWGATLFEAMSDSTNLAYYCPDANDYSSLTNVLTPLSGAIFNVTDIISNHPKIWDPTISFADWYNISDLYLTPDIALTKISTIAQNSLSVSNYLKKYNIPLLSESLDSLLKCLAFIDQQRKGGVNTRVLFSPYLLLHDDTLFAHSSWYNYEFVWFMLLNGLTHRTIISLDNVRDYIQTRNIDNNLRPTQMTTHTYWTGAGEKVPFTSPFGFAKYIHKNLPYGFLRHHFIQIFDSDMLDRLDDVSILYTLVDEPDVTDQVIEDCLNIIMRAPSHSMLSDIYDFMVYTLETSTGLSAYETSDIDRNTPIFSVTFSQSQTPTLKDKIRQCLLAYKSPIWTLDPPSTNTNSDDDKNISFNHELVHVIDKILHIWGLNSKVQLDIKKNRTLAEMRFFFQLGATLLYDNVSNINGSYQYRAGKIGLYNTADVMLSYSNNILSSDVISGPTFKQPILTHDILYTLLYGDYDKVKSCITNIDNLFANGPELFEIVSTQSTTIQMWHKYLYPILAEFERLKQEYASSQDSDITRLCIQSLNEYIYKHSWLAINESPNLPVSIPIPDSIPFYINLISCFYNNDTSIIINPSIIDTKLNFSSYYTPSFEDGLHFRSDSDISLGGFIFETPEHKMSDLNVLDVLKTHIITLPLSFLGAFDMGKQPDLLESFAQSYETKLPPQILSYIISLTLPSTISNDTTTTDVYLNRWIKWALTLWLYDNNMLSTTHWKSKLMAITLLMDECFKDSGSCFFWPNREDYTGQFHTYKREIRMLETISNNKSDDVVTYYTNQIWTRSQTPIGVDLFFHTLAQEYKHKTYDAIMYYTYLWGLLKTDETNLISLLTYLKGNITLDDFKNTMETYFNDSVHLLHGMFSFKQGSYLNLIERNYEAILINTEPELLQLKNIIETKREDMLKQPNLTIVFNGFLDTTLQGREANEWHTATELLSYLTTKMGPSHQYTRKIGSQVEILLTTPLLVNPLSSFGLYMLRDLAYQIDTKVIPLPPPGEKDSVFDIVVFGHLLYCWLGLGMLRKWDEAAHLRDVYLQPWLSLNYTNVNMPKYNSNNHTIEFLDGRTFRYTIRGLYYKYLTYPPQAAVWSDFFLNSSFVRVLIQGWDLQNTKWLSIKDDIPWKKWYVIDKYEDIEDVFMICVEKNLTTLHIPWQTENEIQEWFGDAGSLLLHKIRDLLLSPNQNIPGYWSIYHISNYLAELDAADFNFSLLTILEAIKKYNLYPPIQTFYSDIRYPTLDDQTLYPITWLQTVLQASLTDNVNLTDSECLLDLYISARDVFRPPSLVDITNLNRCPTKENYALGLCALTTLGVGCYYKIFKPWYNHMLHKRKYTANENETQKLLKQVKRYK